MQQTLKSFYSLLSLSACLILLMLPGLAYAAGSDSAGSDSPDSKNESKHIHSGSIVVTIKPLYSLVAYLTEGIEQPVLLMKQTQSPHHYNMKPSERRLLADARMIVWLGPQMESYLSKIIQQQKDSIPIVTALHAEHIKFLNKRSKHEHDSHDHESERATEPEMHLIDPHVWLSTGNAIAISKHISDELMANDPENVNRYKSNLRLLLKKIEHSRISASKILRSNKQPFIAFHDAFQYFEDEYSLNNAGAINFGDETGASLKHLRQIQTRINEGNIQCLVYQPPEPALVKSLSKQTAIKTVALDPLGLEISDNKNAWFELIHNLAVNFNRCLQP